MSDDAPHGDWTALIDAATAGNADAVAAAMETSDVNAADPDGWTALHIAARSGNPALAKLLLSCPDIEVNARNKWKSTPLMIAAGSGHLDIVEMLLGHPKIAIDMRAEYYGRTALIEAAVKGHISIVKALIANGADVNRFDKTGRNSALVESIKNGHVDVAIHLLRSGRIDFSNSELRHQTLVWSGSRSDDLLWSELDAAWSRFFGDGRNAAT